MAEMKCETCKFWKRPEYRTAYNNAVRYRYSSLERWEEASERSDRDDTLFGLCMKIQMGVDLPMDRPTPLATTMDGSGYRADLFTRAEFGCVLWEEKEINA